MNNSGALVFVLLISATAVAQNVTNTPPLSSVAAASVVSNKTVSLSSMNPSSVAATSRVASDESTSVSMSIPNIKGSVASTRVASNESSSVVATAQTGSIITMVATLTAAPNTSMSTPNIRSSVTVASNRSSSVVASVASTTVAPNASSSTTVVQNISSSAAAPNLSTSMLTSTVVMVPSNYSSSVATPSHNIFTSEAVNFTVSKAGNSTQTASIPTMLNSTQSPQSTVPFTSAIGLKPSINASTLSPSSSPNSTVSGNGTISLQPTPSIGSSVYSNETSQPSKQVPSIPSSFTSLDVTTESSPSEAISITSIAVPSTFTLSASGQTSIKSRPPSSEAVTHSSNASQSTQLDTSMLTQSSSILTQSSSMAVVSVMIQGSLTVSVSNSSSTPSLEINATTASSKTTPSTSAPPTPFTLPPEGTRVVNMEVTFEMEYKDGYSDPESKEYKELEKNLRTALNNVYENVEGFVAVRILLITEGSVVCSYIVILEKNSKVEESELKDKLEEAKGELEKLGFPVISVKITDQTKEKLPKWALAVMIVLGCLSAVCVIAMFYVCVKYRRTLYGSSDAYLVSSGEVGIVHTYDTISIGDNKKRTNQGNGQRSTPERRVIGSHTNPTYGANGALGD